MMKRWLTWGLGAATATIVACTASQPAPEPKTQLKPIAVETMTVVTGQTVYVPVYSHIYTVDRSRRIDLTATLSIRNTDVDHAIVITSVKYFGTNGNLIRTDLERPGELPPLASTDFVVDQSDTNGGVGASFIVEWIAEAAVSDPVIEAVMIDTISNQGISFTSPGRVIQRRNAESN